METDHKTDFQAHFSRWARIAQGGSFEKGQRMAIIKNFASKKIKSRKTNKEQRKFVLFLEPNNRKKTLGIVVARTGKRIKLNETEAHFLADALTRQIREWR